MTPPTADRLAATVRAEVWTAGLGLLLLLVLLIPSGGPAI
jgi:hypothetical protein